MVVFVLRSPPQREQGILTGLVCILTGFGLVLAKNAGVLPPSRVRERL